MKISVAFEFNSNNSSSTNSNWQFREGLKETEKENIWMAVEKMRKGKRKFERKGRDINYAERRSMLQNSLKL